MRSSDSALRSVLYDHNVMVSEDLITVDLAAYGVQRWTTGPAQVTVGGNLYTLGPAIRPGNPRSALGSEVATCDLTLEGLFQISGRTISSRALSGEFDNRDVTFRRLFRTAWTDSPGTPVDVFSGRVAEVLLSSFAVELRLKSVLYKTEEKRPLRVVQAMCPWVLYDANCGATKATFTHARTVGAGSTTASVVISATSTFATPGGTVEFTSGALSGVVAVVRSVNGTTLTLATSLPQAPAEGDGVNVVRGCDRTVNTCGVSFSRLLAHGGFPLAPYKEA